MIYDREEKKLIEDKSFGGKQTRFLYSTTVGRTLLLFISSKWFSGLRSRSDSRSSSVKKIEKIEKTYEIDASEYEGTFRSFNDFFTRKLKPGVRPFSKKSSDFISPADSKLLHKTISEQLTLAVKGGQYSLSEMVEDETIADSYRGGSCLIFRLTIDDCHRYIFPDDGEREWTKTIDGKLHTVQPIAHKSGKPFIRNHRVVSGLRTKNFGDIVMIEVGALLVGKIKNHKKANFKKGDEKGYFELGGSTIILLLKPGVLKIDKDILDYSKKDIEIKVKQGETIGGRNV